MVIIGVIRVNAYLSLTGTTVRMIIRMYATVREKVIENLIFV